MKRRPKKPIMFVILFLTSLYVYAQSGIEQRITISLDNVTLEQAIKGIEERSGISFSYAEDIPARYHKRITVKLENQPARELLEQLFKGSPLTYSTLGNRVVLQPDPAWKPAATSLPSTAIEGRVMEDSRDYPLQGASVQLEGSGRSAITDETGYFKFDGLNPGVYKLTASFIGFTKTSSENITVKEGETVTMAIRMPVQKGYLQTVVVTTGRRLQPVNHTSDRMVIEEIKRAQGVVSGIASEQISKSADVNAAEVVKRIPGVTVTDESFIVVRGMNQRYNVTYLSDNIAPSTEQYSRAFALQLIPSRIIDKIMVYKSPRPDLFGDFAGGAVKVYTKDALAVKHFDVGLRIGYMPVSTFRNMNSYKGGKTDWLGFDDGSRKLPAAVPAFGDFRKASLTPQEYVKAFNPELSYGTKMALPDLQLTLNYYNVFKMGSKRLYNVTAFAFTNESRYNDDIYRQQGNTLTQGNFNYDNSLTRETRSIETGQLNLMQNFVFKLNDKHQVYFKNFVLQEGRKSTQVRISRPNDGMESAALKKSNILAFTHRLLYTGNVGGNHVSDNDKQALDWNLGYTTTRYSLPDQRVINLSASSQQIGKDILSVQPNWTAAVRGGGLKDRDQGVISRLFLDNREKLYNASADYTRNLLRNIDLKAGTYHFWKERTVYRRVYVVHDALFTDNFSNIGFLPGISAYVNPELVWFREQDMDKVWSTDYFRDDQTGLAIYDFTSPTDAYQATEQYNAGYVSLQARPWNGKVELTGGVRLEHDRQKIAAAQEIDAFNVPLLVDRPRTVWLPSVNGSYRPNESWVLRASYGRTVNRPEFREITPFTDFDYMNNELVVGNGQLETAMIDNYDVRFEYYPQKNKGETFSIGAFYKHLNKPIERIVFSDVVASGVFTSITFRNADEATVYGLEAEIRKSLSFIPGKFFSNLSFVANGAWIHSETWKDSIRDDEHSQVAFARTFRRPLQGQAPYVVNAGFFYDNKTSGTKASVIWNVSGTNIYAAGVYSESVYAPSGTRGSILQLPRHLLDVAVTQRIARRWQAKLSVQNLLNKEVLWAEDNDFNNQYNPEKLVETSVPGVTAYEGDNVYQRYNPGRYFLLSMVYSF